MPRNVFSLSNVDEALPKWFKEEAQRRSRPGERVLMCELVDVALREYVVKSVADELGLDPQDPAVTLEVENRLEPLRDKPKEPEPVPAS